MSQAAERLKLVLDYLEELVQLDERVTTSLGAHKLPGGQNFVLHQHEVAGLPGVRLGVVEAEGIDWLRLARPKRTEPPKPEPEVARWLDIGPDPDRLPDLRDSVVVTVSAPERDRLVVIGAVRSSDCVPSPKVARMWDVRLVRSEQQGLDRRIDAYIAQQWKPWADAEKPVRLTIELYRRLFELAQSIDAAGTDQPIELVWGMGLARWQLDDRVIDLPLVERLVEIEVTADTGAEIRIRPRPLRAEINLRAFEAVRPEEVHLAEPAARRALDIAETIDDVSPFAPATYESALSAMANLLDRVTRLVPAEREGEPLDAPPEPDRTLTIRDRWVLYARRKSDGFLLRDIQALKKAVTEAAAKDTLPAPGRILVMGPEEPASASEGDPDKPPAPPAPRPEVEPFFPKPFNADQVEIVRRLEHQPGLVVQGPPGTGKTHTIANIICHYLASGRRVLVTSHGETALAVLRDQLPESIRDLAISLTSNEREGMRQAEYAARRLQTVIGETRPDDIRSAIADLTEELARTRRRLAACGEAVGEIADRNHRPLAGTDELPYETARRITSERTDHSWFTDQPSVPLSGVGLAQAELDEIRTLRKQIGPDLEFIGDELPKAQDLPEPTALARLHEDLVRAHELSGSESVEGRLARRLSARLEPATAQALVSTLDDAAAIHRVLAESPWLAPFCAFYEMPEAARALAPLMQEFLEDARKHLSHEPQFLNRPVFVPEQCLFSEEFEHVMTGLANGQKVFGLFSFNTRGIKPMIDTVRVVGQPVKQSSDWQHALNYLLWRRAEVELTARWQPLAVQSGAARYSGGRIHDTRSLAALVGQLELALVKSKHVRQLIDELLRSNLLISGEADALQGDPRRASLTARALEGALVAKELQKGKLVVEELKKRFSGKGLLSQIVRDEVLGLIGDPSTTAAEVERDWRDLLTVVTRVGQHGEAFHKIVDLAERFQAADAAKFAGALVSEPVRPGSPDPVMRPGWEKAWDWSMLMNELKGLGQHEKLAALNRERAELEQLERSILQELVKLKTHLALAENLSGGVRSALQAFMTALKKIGRGTGKTADWYRRAAREALERCYTGLPCWIMPSWRVSEQLPADLGLFDLVILDEASQSDVREMAALLRGKKILVVGDDRQVSPAPVGIDSSLLHLLVQNYLAELPSLQRPLLLPGSSLYDLARVMYPEKLLMLKEHFRCVEPVIRFSMQFYQEPLVPLRIPVPSERLSPPLVDILVRGGKRSGRGKLNLDEARVLVNEIAVFVRDPTLARFPGTDRYRSIGVISLLGRPQAQAILKMLQEDDRIGEEIILRHRIQCGDSATFQGDERDVVFLSMVADKENCRPLTHPMFEQRFNVALSRARDRMILVRSVEESDLAPEDLRARVLAHFRAPMQERQVSGADMQSLLERCESELERAVASHLLGAGYRVRPQVGAEGYRIDLVVEGEDDRRLAIECDGDRLHGPERWAQDMARQRVLERVGWRFWRCWGVDFVLDPKGTMADLEKTLHDSGIEPLGAGFGDDLDYTSHRIVDPPPVPEDTQLKAGALLGAAAPGITPEDDARPRAAPNSERQISVGDLITLQYLDPPRGKTVTYRLHPGLSDEPRGLLSAASPLGRALLNASEEEEIEFEVDGQRKRVIVLRVDERLEAAE